MCHSSAVGFLAFALCLYACVCASVAADNEDQQHEITSEQATKAVDAAMKSIIAVLEKAGSNSNSATVLLQKVKLFETQAKEAESQATQALSQAEKAAKENKEANTLVGNIKTISTTVSALYLKAKTKLENTNASLGEVLKKAEKLKTDCDNEEAAIKGSPSKYTEINTKALQIKQKGNDLNDDITTALEIMNGIDSIEKDMEENVTKAQLSTLRVIAIIAVNKIETIMGDAESIIQTTQDKKNEVNGIVKEMKKHCTTATTESNRSIKALCDSANDALTKVTEAVDKAQEAEKEIMKEKGIADAALKKVQTATVVTDSKREVTTAEACVTTVGKTFVPKLKSALETATTSLTNANRLMQEMTTALSNAKNNPSTEEITATEKANHPVRQGTEPDQKGTKTKPTSKELPDQTDNSAGQPNDKLINSAHNVPTTALTGGKAPAPGAKNDSAMTVSVPLLLALIASAVLQ